MDHFNALLLAMRRLKSIQSPRDIYEADIVRRNTIPMREPENSYRPRVTKLLENFEIVEKPEP